MLKRYWNSFKDLELRDKLLVLFIFSLPFERIPTTEFSGITLKPSLLFGILYLIASAKNLTREKLQKQAKFLCLPALFIAYSLASYLWSVDTTAWFKTNLNLGFVVATFYFIALESRSKLNLILKTLIASSLVVIGFGFFQWFGDLLGLNPSLTGIREEYNASRLGLPRMHSVLLEPLYFSLFLLLPLGVVLGDKRNKLFGKFQLRLAFVALIYTSILLSLARGAIVASAVMGLIAPFYNYSELKSGLSKKFVLRALGALLAIVLVLAGLVTALGQKGTDEDNNYSKGLGTLTGHLKTIRPWGNDEDAEDQNSLNSRDVAREQALGLLKEGRSNLIFGVGAGQYGASLNPAQEEDATSNFVALDVWAEYGLLGIALLLTFGILLVLKVRLRNSTSVGLILYLVGFVVQSVTFGELAILHLWVALGLLAMLARSEEA